MPIPLTQKIKEPNAVFAPQIVLQQTIAGGKITTGAIIMLAPAKVNADGTWENTGNAGKTIHIADITKLEDDIKSIAPQIQTIYGALLAMIETVNTIRKVL